MTGLRLLCCSLVLGFAVSTAVAQVELGADPVSQAAIQIAEKLVQAAQPRSGEVVAEDWNDIAHPVLYVALGSKDGVVEDTMLDVIAKGEPIKVGEEIIGYMETPVAKARITRVQSERLSLARVETIVAGQRPGKGCLANVKTVPGTLAVCALQNPRKEPTALGQEFADKLALALQVTGRFQVMERSRFEDLLKSLNASAADLASPDKSLALAPKIPVRGLIGGTIAQQNDRYLIAARVTEVGSDLPLATATATTNRSDDLDKLYGQKVTDGGGTPPPPPPPPPGEQNVFAREMKWTAKAGFLGPAQNVTVAGEWWPETMWLKPSTAGVVDLTVALDKRWTELALEMVSGQNPPMGFPVLGWDAVDVAFYLDGKQAQSVRVSGEKTQIKLDVTGATTLRLVANGPIYARQGTRFEATAGQP